MRFSINLPSASDPFAFILVAFIFGFIPGAIPFGYLVGRLKGLDIRRQGSGNVGFTNVARVMGWPFALPVLLLDLAKGAAPVYFLGRLIRSLVETPGELLSLYRLFGARFELLVVVAGLGAILGHLFTPVLRFKGGKGVATTAGVFLALSPGVLGLSFAVFLLALLVSRYLSLASVIAAISLPVAAAVFSPRLGPVFGLALVTALVILIRHRPNLKRLLAGTEPRFTLRPARTNGTTDEHR
jgi:glycerol-3-phosphate acyltransferase PlsY